MTVKIEISETRCLVKEVEATSIADAVTYVTALYRAGEIKLTDENSQSNFEVEPV